MVNRSTVRGGGRCKYPAVSTLADHRWGTKLCLPALLTNVPIQWYFANQSFPLLWPRCPENWTRETWNSSVRDVGQRFKPAGPQSSSPANRPEAAAPTSTKCCDFFSSGKKRRYDYQNLSMRSFTKWTLCLLFHSPATGGRRAGCTPFKFLGCHLPLCSDSAGPASFFPS